jgi:hypothetical protein
VADDDGLSREGRRDAEQGAGLRRWP